VELERRETELVETLASGRRHRDRVLIYLVAASTLIASAALVLTLIR
jgi:hypothetical protein